MAKEIENEVRRFAPKVLTPTSYLLLLFLSDSANAEDRIVCLSNDRAIKDTRSSLSAIKNSYNQLADLNIVHPVDETEIPDRVRHYKSRVRRIMPVAEWRAIYNRDTDSDEGPAAKRGPESGPGQNLTVEGARIWPRRGPESDPKPKTINQLQETKNTSGSAGRGRKATQSDDGLDPAQSLGLFNKPSLPRVKRDKPPAADSGMGLVFYFERSLSATETGRQALNIPDPINYTALAGVFNRWKRDGMTPEHIRTLIDIYCTGKISLSIPAWRDFLSRRSLLISAAEAASLQNVIDDHLSPESLAYWGVLPEDVALYTTSADSEHPDATDRPRSH